MKMIVKDILTVKQGIIVQQVNCRGAMGAGLAKRIRQAYPQVYTSYMKACSMYTPNQLLGMIQFIRVADDLFICNFFTQLNFGFGVAKVFTDYTAFELALNKLALKIDRDMPIYIPYKIGCGLAGGDWKVIKELIGAALCDRDVTICKKDNTCFRICIKLEFGGFGLIQGFESLEEALFEFKKCGNHLGKPYVIMDNDDTILYDGENFKEEEEVK